MQQRGSSSKRSKFQYCPTPVQEIAELALSTDVFLATVGGHPKNPESYNPKTLSPDQSRLQDIAELALSTDVFLALVGSHEDSVADAASHCVALLSVAAPRSTGGTLLQNVPQVLQVLETANMCQSKALLTM